MALVSAFFFASYSQGPFAVFANHEPLMLLVQVGSGMPSGLKMP
jgi:hypothetical protein